MHSRVLPSCQEEIVSTASVMVHKMFIVQACCTEILFQIVSVRHTKVESNKAEHRVLSLFY